MRFFFIAFAFFCVGQVIFPRFIAARIVGADKAYGPILRAALAQAKPDEHLTSVQASTYLDTYIHNALGPNHAFPVLVPERTQRAIQVNILEGQLSGLTAEETLNHLIQTHPFEATYHTVLGLDPAQEGSLQRTAAEKESAQIRNTKGNATVYDVRPLLTRNNYHILNHIPEANSEHIGNFTPSIATQQAITNGDVQSQALFNAVVALINYYQQPTDVGRAQAVQAFSQVQDFDGNPIRSTPTQPAQIPASASAGVRRMTHAWHHLLTALNNPLAYNIALEGFANFLLLYMAAENTHSTGGMDVRMFESLLSTHINLDQYLIHNAFLTSGAAETWITTLTEQQWHDSLSPENQQSVRNNNITLQDLRNAIQAKDWQATQNALHRTYLLQTYTELARHTQMEGILHQKFAAMP